MSWKPARGSGINFQRTSERECKYRNLIWDSFSHPLSIKDFSKIYYHWLVAERDLRNLNHPSKHIDLQDIYGELISKNQLKSLETHTEMCYKPLRKIIKNHEQNI